MHREFARGATIIQGATFKIGNRQHVFRRTAFAGHCRGRQHPDIIQPDTDIAIRRNDVAALVHQLADAHQVPSCGLFVHQLLLLYRSRLSLTTCLFNSAATRRAFVTRAFCGSAKKYESDSSDVVRSTVFTFTPRRPTKGAGAKFKTAFTPAAMI